MGIKLNLIVAATENMGIGKNGDLPWRLRKEMAYFTKMTTSTQDSNRKNVVIMGRKTWDSIPSKYKPLSNRINFVLSRSDLKLNEYQNTFAFKNLEEIIKKLESSEFQKLYEQVWVIGGATLYKDALSSPYFYRLYLTKIHKIIECDTFLPALPDNLIKVRDPEISEEIQEENGIQYTYHIYEK